jgi:RNA-directed DNA polymerase
MNQKPFEIPKTVVWRAFELVRANKGAAGVDGETLAEYEKNLKDNLYRLWNRMSSGSYFPPPVRAVPIPKKSGGERILGIPSVSDRIAQMVVKLMFEPDVEPHFQRDSYGYRPGKSALDAIGKTRERCWVYDWVLEFDIRGLFDNIDHELLMRAVRKHTSVKWIILYIERWLKAPMQLVNGTIVTRDKGTPQGGVISPVLSNLFLHYVFDLWMKRNYPEQPWCRYADDGLVHCHTESMCLELLSKLAERFVECGLELHPQKTKIVYCKDAKRTRKYGNTSFDFLGYTFCCRRIRNQKDGSIFYSFNPAVSKASLNAMRARTRKFNFRNRTRLSLSEIAELYNPTIRGWITYYGRYYQSGLYPMYHHLNRALAGWLVRKYKRIRSSKQAYKALRKIWVRNPELFSHWSAGINGVFV